MARNQISLLTEEKRGWTEMKEELERRCEVAENESRKLREENNRLRDELRILDLVVRMAGLDVHPGSGKRKVKARKDVSS